MAVTCDVLAPMCSVTVEQAADPRRRFIEAQPASERDPLAPPTDRGRCCAGVR